MSQCRALPILASGISDDHRLATSFNPTGPFTRSKLLNADWPASLECRNVFPAGV